MYNHMDCMTTDVVCTWECLTDAARIVKSESRITQKICERIPNRRDCDTESTPTHAHWTVCGVATIS